MFSVILKNLHKENTDFNKLNDFLNDLVQKPFFKAHDDYHYDKIMNLLSSMTTYETDEYKGMRKIYAYRHNRLTIFIYKDSYKKCVCTCITGLHQILTRNPQHYRAIHRLANLYENFLNKKVAVFFILFFFSN